MKRNKKFLQKTRGILSILCLSLVLTGCSAVNKENTSERTEEGKETTAINPISKSSIKLNTAIQITLYDSDDVSIIDSAFELCDYYEDLLSRTISTSEIYRLNEAGTANFQVSDETMEVLSKGLEYSKLSEGLFDITIAPLTSLWDFGSSNPKRPADADIEEAISHIGYQNVSLNGNTVTFKEDGMKIDLGAIAKGFIADKLKEHLLSKGVNSAMINLGGNVLCVGKKPNGAPFNVGIQKPFADRSETIAVMQLEDVSVVSSGIYERFFTEDGVAYHHILNPFTGFPVDNDLISVTIISPYSVDGDALSTICFALGLEKGLELIESIEGTYAIFITSDYELHYSEGFLENINMLE